MFKQARQNRNDNVSIKHHAVAKAMAMVAGLALLLALVNTSATPLQAGGNPHLGNPNPGIIPPHAKPCGRTYGEWTAAWWQWALSIPADRNPLLTSGEYCGEGQSGPVWFYAGNFGWDEEKFCTMPRGKKLFMPVYNWIFGSAVWDCDPTHPNSPGVPCVVEDLREAAAAAVLAWEVMEVTIDGVPVQSIDDYRALSPEPEGFSITLPEDNVLELPSGIYFPHVADGYWLMLTPLPPGEHTLRVYVSAPSVEIEFEVITHLTVE